MIKESFQIGNILLSPISKSESPWFSMSTSPRVVNSAKGSFAGSLIGSMPAGSGTLGLSLRYFQSGEIIYRDSDGNDLGLIRPYATDFSLGYSLPVSEIWDMGLTLRYVSSDLTQGQINNTKLSGLLLDLGAHAELSDEMGLWMSIRNLGAMLSTEINTNGYAPTLFQMGWYNSAMRKDLQYGFQIEKSLAPTAPNLDPSGVVTGGLALPESWARAIAQSFSDAPGGALEEFQELRASFGAAYALNKDLTIRTGLSLIDPSKSVMKYVSLGVSYRYNNILINTSYAFPVMTSLNALKNQVLIGFKVEI